MSNIYLTEPPTDGKVVLHTAFGDIDVELWSKEAPLACRNFIQLCLENYYNNTKFHRIVPNFMIQGGDPSGGGKGGESIYGRPFRNEIHNRLRFNHRGIVAMANENTSESNNSQFFITLAACEWLDRKHTIFGKVTGNSIFNVLRMSEIELEDDRPLDPPMISSVSVLMNPFVDVTPRIQIQTPNDIIASQSAPAVVGNVVATRKLNKKLLSFIDDVDVDDSIVLSSIYQAKAGSSSSEAVDIIQPIQSVKSVAVLKPALQQQSVAVISSSVISAETYVMTLDMTLSSNDLLQQQQDLRDEIESYKKARLDASLQSSLDQSNSNNIKGKVQGDELLPPTEMKRKQTTRIRQKNENREFNTLSKLIQFRNSIRKKKTEYNIDHAGKDDDVVKAEVYSGQVLEGKNNDDDEEEDKDGLEDDWFVRRLKFKHHIDDDYRNDKDYVTIDSRKPK